MLDFSDQDTDLVAVWRQRCGTTYPNDALKPGDIIVAVNHIQMSCPNAHSSMIFQLSNAAELLVMVRRERARDRGLA